MAKKSPKSNGSPKSSVVNVGLTQMSCAEDVKANRTKQIRLVEEAAKQGAQIICTQELFRSQYFCQVEDHAFFKLAETIPGPTTDAFCKAREEAQGRHHRVAVREARRRPLPQHRRDH